MSYCPAAQNNKDSDLNLSHTPINKKDKPADKKLCASEEKVEKLYNSILHCNPK
jgi:hypothetical protein